MGTTRAQKGHWKSLKTTTVTSASARPRTGEAPTGMRSASRIASGSALGSSAEGTSAAYPGSAAEEDSPALRDAAAVGPAGGRAAQESAPRTRHHETFSFRIDTFRSHQPFACAGRRWITNLDRPLSQRSACASTGSPITKAGAPRSVASGSSATRWSSR